MAEEFVRLAVNQRLRLGRYLLLFPHVVEGKRFHTTLTRKLLCWSQTVLLTATAFLIMISVLKKRGSLDALVWTPLITSYMTLVINQIWMHKKKDKLNSFLSNLQECRPYLKVDNKVAMIKSYLPIFSQFLVNISSWIILTRREKHLTLGFAITVFYFQMGLFLCFVTLEQFLLLLSLIHQQLSRTNFLSDTDQDALIAAAVDLNKVFSPHLLVIIMTVFVAQLGRIYKTIALGNHADLHFLTVVIMQCFPIWRVVSNCQQFIKEVEQFYNRTYYYLLTHKHKIDNRMEFHLSRKKKFVFSAGGMFNVDFQLLSSMVTTTVTYVVVLLQFSRDKEQLTTAA